MSKTVDVFPALVLDCRMEDNPDVVEMLVILDERQTVEHYHTQIRNFPARILPEDIEVNDTYRITITTEPGKVHTLLEKHHYPHEMWDKPDYFADIDPSVLFDTEE